MLSRALRPAGSLRSNETTLVAETYGRRFAVEGPTDIVGRISGALPWGSALTTGAPERTWRIGRSDDGPAAWVDDDFLAWGTSPGYLAHRVAEDIELWVAEHAKERIFVHAAAVLHRGRALVIPGGTRAGKSTLAAALVKVGAEYLSDEFAVVDLDGRVHPYRRPPRQRADSPAASWPAPDLAADLAGAWPVALVAALTHGEGAPITEVRRASMVMTLLGSTVCASTRPVEAMDALSAACLHAVCLKGRRQEAEETAGALLELMDRTSGESQETLSIQM